MNKSIVYILCFGLAGMISVGASEVVQSVEYDLNRDGKPDRLSILMVEGKRYVDETQWEGMGDKFEGQFDIVISMQGGLTTTNHLNKLFYPKRSDDSMFFLVAPWELQFMDYNGDGNVDFNLGQYYNGVNYECRLFTIRSDGSVSELPVEKLGSGLLVADRSPSTKKIEVGGDGAVCTEMYSRDRGQYITNRYEWSASDKCFHLDLSSAASNFEKAETLYEAGYRERAKDFYLKAAEEGIADAHFNLSYCYTLLKEEQVYHFVEAAKQGHAEALEYALDGLLITANSLQRTDPKKALEIYYTAKAANPGLELFSEEETLLTLRRCSEPKAFDVDAFIKKYNLDETELESRLYGIWELAEEASRGGRFGAPDPELVFNLVMRGGWVPFEFESAVEECYVNWKNGEVKEFNIGDHVTSGAGMSYCAFRYNKEVDAELRARVESIAKHLGGSAKNLLNAAYSNAVSYIDCKASYEEGHSGTGRGAWMISSGISQKRSYVEFIEKIINGYEPDADTSLQDAHKKLVDRCKVVEKELNKDHDFFYMIPTLEEYRTVQQLWSRYMASSCRLFSVLNPGVPVDRWKSFLIQERVLALEALLELATTP